MTTKTATTKTQQRAVCPACFAQQAIRTSGRLVPHGYTRPQHWHSNVGTCSGAGHMHFGTDAGRDYTASLAQRLRDAAADGDKNATRVLDGLDPVLVRERVKGTRVYTMARVEHATAEQRKHYAAQLAQTAEQWRAQAAELDAHVAAWKPAAPIAVAVETKTTLLHWRGGYWGGKACAASAMAAQTGWTTSEINNVTCAKCKERHARWTAAAASA